MPKTHPFHSPRTHGFVRVAAAMLGAPAEIISTLRFQFAPERPDPKERLEAVEKFVQLGGRVSESEVRDLLGLSEPQDGDRLLTGSASGSDTLTGLLGAGAPPEGQTPPPDAQQTFSKRQWW